MISCARKVAFVTMISIALAACAEDDTTATGATRTVEWFQEHTKERDAILKECWNNPGELAGEPNCANAEQASRLDSSGTLRDIDIPPLRFGQRDQESDD